MLLSSHRLALTEWPCPLDPQSSGKPIKHEMQIKIIAFLRYHIIPDKLFSNPPIIIDSCEGFFNFTYFRALIVRIKN